ncbi:hypothetical protein HID58_065589, partial [Brassica napus]
VLTDLFFNIFKTFLTRSLQSRAQSTAVHMGHNNFIFIDTLQRCESVSVSMFDGLAFAFHKKLESYVVLVPSINPKAGYFSTALKEPIVTLTLRHHCETQ